jgi:hypothetical protein
VARARFEPVFVLSASPVSEAKRGELTNYLILQKSERVFKQKVARVRFEPVFVLSASPVSEAKRGELTNYLILQKSE